MPGWKQKTAGIKSWSNLPVNAQRFIKRIEALTSVKVGGLSTGPQRDDYISLVEL